MFKKLLSYFTRSSDKEKERVISSNGLEATVDGEGNVRGSMSIFFNGKKLEAPVEFNVYDDDYFRRLDEFSNEIENDITALRAENEAWSKAFNELMTYQNGGMRLEKEGLLEDAVDQYERAIRFGEENERMKINNYYHSIERLAIVYRKLKRYDDEIRIVNLALSKDIQDSDRAKMQHRLEKSILLKNRMK